MFESAKLKVQRAKKHILELHSALLHFIDTKPYKVLSDFDERVQLYGLRVAMTEPLPADFGLMIGDSIHNLRSALEHVASDLVAAAIDERARERSKFPMHENRQNLEDTLLRGEIHTHFPEVAEAILNHVKPFKDGNRLLWTIGKLWNIDKHRLPITSYGITRIDGISASNSEKNHFVENASATVQQGRMVGLVATSVPLTITDYGIASFYMQFDEPGLLEGDPVIQTLLQMCKVTRDAIDVVEQAYDRSPKA